MDTPRIVVAAVAAYYRSDQADGVSITIEFPDRDGMAFCEELERWYQATEASEEHARHMLAWCATYKGERAFTFREAVAIIRAVYFLRRRGRIPSDEHNGPMFLCLVADGDAVCSELNPAKCDLAAELRGENAVELTDVLRAARRSGNGPDAMRAIRAVVDHARGEVPHQKGGGSA